MSLNDALKNLGQVNATALNRKSYSKVFPTGLTKFDNEVLGTGGLVGGKIYELYAKPSAGKTSLALKIIAHLQKQQLLAAYIDAEQALFLGGGGEDKLGWVEAIGVDLKQLLLPDFQTGEDAFKVIKTLIASGVNIIAVDTVATLMPEDLVFRENEKSKMNENQARAKMLTNGFNDIVGSFTATRRLASGREDLITVSPEKIKELAKSGFSINNPTVHKLSYYDCVLIGINHAKDKVGVLYGDPTYTVGGASLGFHSSVRIGMSEPARSKAKVLDLVSGVEVPEFRSTRVVAAKNKLAPPFNEVKLKIYRDGRIIEDILFWQEAVKLGLVEATSQTITITQTGEKFKKKEFEIWASENPDFFQGKLSEENFEPVEEDDESDYKEIEKKPLPKISTKAKLPSIFKKE